MSLIPGARFALPLHFLLLEVTCCTCAYLVRRSPLSFLFFFCALVLRWGNSGLPGFYCHIIPFWFWVLSILATGGLRFNFPPPNSSFDGALRFLLVLAGSVHYSLLNLEFSIGMEWDVLQLASSACEWVKSYQMVLYNWSIIVQLPNVTEQIND